MRPEMLTVVAVLNNPLRWNTRVAHFRNLINHLIASRARVVIVECAYGERPFEIADQPGIKLVQVRSKTVLWQKENLIRLGLLHAGDWNYAAWIDGDSHMTHPDWVMETLHALQLYKVVQISSEMISLGPKHEHLGVAPSLMKRYQDHLWDTQPGPNGSIYDDSNLDWLKKHGYPGLAWAYRREAYDDLGGLLDLCILGSGDHHMAYGLLGLPDPTAERGGCRYAAMVSAWRERASRHICGDVGLVPGVAVHFWHGNYAKRRYSSRWHILSENEYDPDRDVCYDAQGLLKLTGNKPQLRDELRVYFSQRDEDSTEL